MRADEVRGDVKLPVHPPQDGSVFDADYFLRGKETGKSLYHEYRWLPKLTIPMAGAIMRHLSMYSRNDTILDYGCARGYAVKALRMLGYPAWGYDISQWALENADPEVRDYLICNETAMFAESFDWVITKDVLEHVHVVSYAIPVIMELARKGVFAVVPLAHGPKYEVLEYEEDVTHIHRRPLEWWAGQFMRPGWSVEARYRVDGVKDNYAQHPTGNGFITARRL